MPSTAITEQPVQQSKRKVIVGLVQHRDKKLTIPVEDAISLNEAREKLLEEYPTVFNVWIERN
jgi:hypothetical protein